APISHLHSFPTRRSSDLAEQSGAVPGFDLDADRIELAAAGIPIDLDNPLLVGHVHDVLAARSVHRDALAPGDVSADGVARYGLRSEEHTSELQSPYDLVC